MDKSKLVLPIAIVLVGIIIGGFYYADLMRKKQSVEHDLFDELEIDVEPIRYKEVFLERCMEGGEEFVSKEYCECAYDYLIYNYDTLEWGETMTEVLEGKVPLTMKDARRACEDKI